MKKKSPSQEVPKKKNKPGRKPKVIDWEMVDKLLVMGCNAREIAGNFDLTDERFCERFYEHHKVFITEYSAKKRSMGHSILRAKQFQRAIKGNTQLLIFLGKNVLGQSENPRNEEVPLDSVLDSENENMELKAKLAKSELITQKLLEKLGINLEDVDQP